MKTETIVGVVAAGVGAVALGVVLWRQARMQAAIEGPKPTLANVTVQRPPPEPQPQPRTAPPPPNPAQVIADVSKGVAAGVDLLKGLFDAFATA